MKQPVRDQARERIILFHGQLGAVPWLLFLHRKAAPHPHLGVRPDGWDTAKWQANYLEDILAARTERTARSIPILRRAR